MSIRSFIAVALGCALLSGAAYAAPPPHSQGKPEKTKDQPGAPGKPASADSATSSDAMQQCLDSGGTWTSGVCNTAENQCLSTGGSWTNGVCITAEQQQCYASGGVWTSGVCGAPLLQQLTCMMVMPPQGLVTPGPMLLEIRNSTPGPLPSQTVIWMGPPSSTSINGVTAPSGGVNPDGTPGNMDRYLKLAAELPAGGSLRPQYIPPSPGWPGCTAVIGMIALNPQVSFVE